MKKPFILMMLMCVVLLTGCSSLVNLTEDESDMLTEYMAGVVLKHSDDYKDGLLTKTEIEELEAKEEERNKKLVANSNEKKEVQVTSKNPSNSKNQALTETKDVSLTKAVGNKNFNIEYKQFKSYDKYVSEDKSSNVALEAGKNKKLLVLYFDVKNLSNETMKIDLVEEGIGYQLILNNGDKVKPLLTLLMNDIQYLNLDIAANKTKDAVIVFEVDKNEDLSNTSLKVTRKDMTSSIDLK